jgi:hypothetical protein
VRLEGQVVAQWLSRLFHERVSEKQGRSEGCDGGGIIMVVEMLASGRRCRGGSGCMRSGRNGRRKAVWLS